MPVPIQCPECGAALPPGQPHALCPRCALKGALDISDDTKLVPPSPTAPEAGERIGRYKLLEKIGEGGCGVVYMAEQEEPVRRRVALKVIKLGMDTKEVIARFEVERQALALMDHPQIARIFDGGATDSGRPFFVMELVRGLRITEYCDQKNLSTRQRLDLFMQVCQAVQHAHQKGIIHRDLKPSNILVTVNDGVLVPKVIDFGIAKATGPRLTDKTLFTRFHQFLGTPAYMSPEQAEMTSVDIDTRSDIYSLGVLLYELLTSRTPFDTKELLRAGMEEMLRTIREQEPVRPSARLSTLVAIEQTTVAQQRQTDAPKLINLVRGDLDWIVMKALEKDRTRRYETANSLAMDIHRHLNNEPVIARPASTAYKLQKAWRRNKVVLASVAAVAMALVVGLTLSIWQAVRATNAEQATREKATLAVTERNNAVEARRAADLQRTNAERNLYFANMNLFQPAWDQNNIDRVHQLLGETATYPQRSFEWYYWQRQAHLELRTLRGHLGGVSAVAFSPDGQRIVTGSEDTTAKVWEATTGQELLTLKGHSVTSVAFSPDGQRIVTGGRDWTAKVWEAASGKQLLTLKGHSDAIRSRGFFPPGQRVAFSPDGHRVVTTSEDTTANIWEAASGKELLTLKGHTNPISSMAFSPDGQRIVTGSDYTAKVWDAASGKELLTLKGHSAGITSVAFSPNGRRIVTGSYGTAEVWEAASGKELLTLKGHGDWIYSVAFSPDGRRIVTGSYDQTAKIWEWASAQELLTLKGHGDRIHSVAFSPDGQRIVTGSADKTAKTWQAASGKELLTLKGHMVFIRSVAFSPDGQRIVTGGADNTAKVWEAASGKELLTLKGHSTGIESAAFSPDGKRIVTGSQDGRAKVWETASGKELLTFKSPGNQRTVAVCSVAFSPDGQRIVIGSGDQSANVWETASGKELLTLKGHRAAIGSVAFSPDGQRIVTGSWDRTAKVWEVASGKELLTLEGHGDCILSVAFSPDGHRIVTGSADKTAKVWETASGKELLTLKGHMALIRSVAFSSDGQRIVTGSPDKTAKVWEAASGKELLTLGDGDHISSVAFSPDGQRIVTGNGQVGMANVWEAATPAEVARWQAEEQGAAERLADERRRLGQ